MKKIEQLVQNIRVERFEEIEMRGDCLMIAQINCQSPVFVQMENIFNARQPGNIEEICPDDVSAQNVCWVTSM